MVSKQEIQPSYLHTLTDSQDLAYGTPPRAPTLLVVCKDSLLVFKDDWGIPIIAPVEGRKAAGTQYMDAAATKRWALLQKPQPASCRMLTFIRGNTQLALALTLSTEVARMAGLCPGLV